MAKSLFARVQIDSPLPQLDSLFDYSIKDGQDVKVGSRVEVNFGKSKQKTGGYVVEISDTTEHQGVIAPLNNVITNATILKPEIYQFCRNIADRQAVSISDVIKLAIPNRSIAVEKLWLEADWKYATPKKVLEPVRKHEVIQLRSDESDLSWAQRAEALIIEALNKNESVIVCVPDFRDQKLVKERLHQSISSDKIVDYSSANKPSTRYAEFLRCLSDESVVVVGSRSALYAPVLNLGLIIVWDDGDSSHQEIASPYIHSREAALIRQELEQCSIVFLSHVVSSEMYRLREIGYLQATEAEIVPSRINVVKSDARIAGEIWKSIRSAIASGPVLVQVAAKGISASSYCANCGTRADCKNCSGPLKVNQSNQLQCRWCNAFNNDFACTACHGVQLRFGRPGSTKTLSDIGKALPGIQLIESNYETRVQTVVSDRVLVVSTPGAEPIAENGYAAVFILDVNNALSRDTLRATEDAVRNWFNAFALGRAGAQLAIADLPHPLSNLIADSDVFHIAQREFLERAKLGLPPAIRVCSISASAQLLQVIVDELQSEPISIYGPVKVSRGGMNLEERLIIKFEYGFGAKFASKLRELTLRLSAGQARFSSKTGKPMRPIRIKMDDPEVV
ncbi:MAG: hypothetical protein ACKOWH_02110 [Rhodoluna sp.]